jgi:hypothetical protein
MASATARAVAIKLVYNALAVYVVEKANTKRTYETHNFLY